MHLLICAATEFEIKPTIEFLRERKTKNVEVLITGVGLMAATYSLTKTVQTKRPDFIIQAGVAGCLDRTLPLSKIVIVENEVIGDLGVEEANGFNSLFDLKLVDLNQFPWKNGKLSNNIGILKQTGLTIVDAVSINEITTNPDKVSLYKNKLKASIESMEGAALHYVGLMENIPFLQIRSLSNFVGERDKSKWVMNIAIANLNLELQRILLKFLNL
jgi:futalosine hydrolase